MNKKKFRIKKIMSACKVISTLGKIPKKVKKKIFNSYNEIKELTEYEKTPPEMQKAGQKLKEAICTVKYNSSLNTETDSTLGLKMIRNYMEFVGLLIKKIEEIEKEAKKS